MSKMLNDDEIDWTNAEDAPGKPELPDGDNFDDGCCLCFAAIGGIVISILFLIYGILALGGLL
jgi:hypothetical protein